MAPSNGDQAPDFELPASAGGRIRLGSCLGQEAVLLVFYSASFEDVCRDDLRRLRDGLGRFEAAGVQVLAVSCDAYAVQRAWAQTEGFGFPLLSDFWPHGEVARAYETFDLDEGCARHLIVAIESTGRVVGRMESDRKAPRPAEHLEGALVLLAKPPPAAPPAAEPMPAEPRPSEPAPSEPAQPGSAPTPTPAPSEPTASQSSASDDEPEPPAADPVGERTSPEVNGSEDS